MWWKYLFFSFLFFCFLGGILVGDLDESQLQDVLYAMGALNQSPSIAHFKFELICLEFCLIRNDMRVTFDLFKQIVNRIPHFTTRELDLAREHSTV